MKNWLQQLRGLVHPGLEGACGDLVLLTGEKETQNTTLVVNQAHAQRDSDVAQAFMASDLSAHFAGSFVSIHF